MKVLLIDPQNRFQDGLTSLSCPFEDVVVVSEEQLASEESDAARADIVLAVGDFNKGSKLIEQLLALRTHPHTALTPCWLAVEREAFDRVCIWPRISIDTFAPKFDFQAFCDWLEAVNEWQQNRMFVASGASLAEHCALEVLNSLALRRATGRLTVFDEMGIEGFLQLADGRLVDAAIGHHSGDEAFFEFFSWTSGGYQWEVQTRTAAEMFEPQVGRPLDALIPEALSLLHDANLLYHFLPDLNQHIEHTESESALDDGAVAFYEMQKRIYYMVDGTLTAAQLLEASPLSRVRTMGILAKWFSLGDIAAAEPPLPETPAEVRRVLIVDDSRLMCRALSATFSKDTRFEIAGVAHDGYEALKMIEQEKPDVVTLDMQMPRMDGLTALKHIMIRDPKPVVVLSAFTKETSQLTYDSFKYGAVDVFTKPSEGNPEQKAKEEAELLDRVAMASAVRMEAAQYIRRSKSNGDQSPLPQPDEAALNGSAVSLILCGAGGFPSLLKLFFAVTNTGALPNMVACMAMPRRVVEALLPNLERDFKVPIEMLTPQACLQPGVLYLYSHDHCYRLVREEGQTRAELQMERHGGHHPADQLLRSAVETFGSRVVALAISGTGADGMAGLKLVRERGGMSLALAPEACLKPELPRQLIDQGAADEVKTVAELATILETPPEELFAKRSVAR